MSLAKEGKELEIRNQQLNKRKGGQALNFGLGNLCG